MGWKVENIGEKLEVVLVQEAWFVAVAVRRSPPFFFCSCPASMNAPGCQLFEFRARKMRYDPSRAILQRAPLNLWIALTPQRFEMLKKWKGVMACDVSTVSLFDLLSCYIVVLLSCCLAVLFSLCCLLVLFQNDEGEDKDFGLLL